MKIWNKQRVWCGVLAFAILLSGCIIRKNADGRTSVEVYRLNSEDGGSQMLVSEKIRYSSGENVLDVVLNALNSVPENVGLTRVFPASVKMMSCSVDDGTASVVMTENYRDLTGIDRLLSDYAITMTLFSFDNICAVNIYSGAEIVAERLTPENVVLADNDFESCQKIVKIYVPDEKGGCLNSRSRKITMGGDDSEAVLLAQKVLAEMPQIPANTSVISADVVNGLCILNLSEEFFGAKPESENAAKLIVFSLVDTLTYLSSIQRVIIQVEGHTISSYGSYHTYWPKSFNAELVQYS